MFFFSYLHITFQNLTSGLDSAKGQAISSFFLYGEQCCLSYVTNDQLLRIQLEKVKRLMWTNQCMHTSLIYSETRIKRSRTGNG